jgi:hypothetical protein
MRVEIARRINELYKEKMAADDVTERRTEDRGQTTEARRQRTEDRGQISAF